MTVSSSAQSLALPVPAAAGQSGTPGGGDPALAGGEMAAAFLAALAALPGEVRPATAGPGTDPASAAPEPGAIDPAGRPGPALPAETALAAAPGTAAAAAAAARPDTLPGEATAQAATLAQLLSPARRGWAVPAPVSGTRDQPQSAGDGWTVSGMPGTTRTPTQTHSSRATPDQTLVPTVPLASAQGRSLIQPGVQAVALPGAAAGLAGQPSTGTAPAGAGDGQAGRDGSDPAAAAAASATPDVQSAAVIRFPAAMLGVATTPRGTLATTGPATAGADGAGAEAAGADGLAPAGRAMRALRSWADASASGLAGTPATGSGLAQAGGAGAGAGSGPDGAAAASLPGDPSAAGPGPAAGSGPATHEALLASRPGLDRLPAGMAAAGTDPAGSAGLSTGASAGASGGASGGAPGAAIDGPGDAGAAAGAGLDAGAGQSRPDASARLSPGHLPHFAASLVRRFESGARSLQLRLDPPELGKVEVRLTVQPDRSVEAVVSTDRPETLAELQRSARDLAAALADAGLDLADGGLSFSLDTGTSGGGAGNGQSARPFARPDDAGGPGAAAATDPAQQAGAGSAAVTQGRTPDAPLHRGAAHDIWQRARVALRA